MAHNHLSALSRRARRLLAFTQEQMAEYMEVQQSTVSRWERGLQAPSPEHVARMQRVCSSEATTPFCPIYIEKSPSVKSLLPIDDFTTRLVLSRGAHLFLSQLGLSAKDFFGFTTPTSAHLDNILSNDQRWLSGDVAFVTYSGITRFAKGADLVPVSGAIIANPEDGTAIIEGGIVPPKDCGCTTICLHKTDCTVETFKLPRSD